MSGNLEAMTTTPDPNEPQWTSEEIAKHPHWRASKKAHMLVERLHQHNIQVAAGLIPEDSPPTWTTQDQKPDEKGLPWWLGPNYNPSPEMLEGMKNEALGTSPGDNGSVTPSSS